MKTKNMFRSRKCEEIERIWQLYPDLTSSERLFMVLDDLVKKSIEKDDHTQLASLNEYARVFDGIFLNPKTGQPETDAINYVRRLVTAIKKDKGHPHIRPFTEPHIETLADGTEVVRNYLNLLRGSKAVTYVNNKLEAQRQGLRETQKTNNDVVNVRRVMKEAEQYKEELIIKQQEIIRKRKERGDRS